MVALRHVEHAVEAVVLEAGAAEQLGARLVGVLTHLVGLGSRVGLAGKGLAVGVRVGIGERGWKQG
jgi:hypothetical protein